MVLALILFALTYILLLVLPDYRYLIALCSAAVFILTGILPAQNALGAINWNVIMMLAGTMIVVQLFIESRMPARLSEWLLTVVPNVCWAVVALSLFAGFISAFVDNVATVLMVAPIGLSVAKQLNINPVPVIISIAVSSNLQGAATLVGDTTSILLGSYLNMNFNDFFYMLGKPGICLAVELGAVATVFVLLWLFRKEKQHVDTEVTTVVTDYVPSVLMVGTVVLLIAASMLKSKPELTNGYICMALALIGTVRACIKERSYSACIRMLKSVDFQTLLLLSGLFMVIEGITQAGVIDAIAQLFVKIAGTSVFGIYTLIVFTSVVLSAFIDNIPYVATMLPVVTGIASLMGVPPYLFAFGLLSGATLGGNLTPVGASANIAGIGILQKDGYEVSTRDFMRIGIPFTLVAVMVGYVTLWVIWG